MKAVVLAAGEGERLAPLTESRPKPMLPAANRPILAYVLDAVVAAGVESIFLVVGYERDHIQEYFGPSYRNTPIEYVVQEKQLGSGHALLQVREHVDSEFLVVNGDQVVDPEMVVDVACEFDSEESVGALNVLQRDDLAQYGAVAVDSNRVTEIVENPREEEFRLLNGGVYAFDDQIFDTIEETPRVEGELSLPETLAQLLEEHGRGVLQAIRTDGLWVDATYAWDLLTVSQRLLDFEWVKGTAMDDRVWIAESARVHESAVIRPPAVIGEDAIVGPNAVIGPYTSLGRNATIAANATVCRSVLDIDTRVGPNTTLLDVVTGRAVDIGAGTAAPSGRADITVADQVEQDQHVGAVLADRVSVGGGVSFAPGTLVGTGSTIGVGAHVSGRIKSGTEVVR